MKNRIFSFVPAQHSVQEQTEHFVACPAAFHAHLSAERFAAMQSLYQQAYIKAFRKVHPGHDNEGFGSGI